MTGTTTRTGRTCTSPVPTRVGADLTAALHGLHATLGRISEPVRGELVDELTTLLAACGQEEAVERVRGWEREEAEEML